ADGASREMVIEELQVLNLIWDAGRGAGLWKGCPPPVPLSMIRPRHSIGTVLADRLEVFRSVREAILRPEVLAYNNFTPKQAAGFLMTTLMVECGVASAALVRAAAYAFNEPILATGAFRYIELGIKSPISGRSATVRVFLSALASMLALRHRQHVVTQICKTPGSLPTSSQVWSSIRDFLQHPVLQIALTPESLATLCLAVQAHYSATLPPFLAAFAKGAIASTSLPESRFREVIGFRPRVADRLGWERALRSEDALGVTPKSIEHDRTLIQAAVCEPASFTQVIASLEELSSGASAQLPATLLLAEWTVHELQAGPAARANRRLTDARKNLARVVPVVLAVCPRLDADILQASHAKDLLRRLNEEVSGSSERTTLARQFERFLSFALSIGEGETLEGVSGRAPSANLCTYAETRMTIELLGSLGGGLVDRELRLAAQNYVRGINLGLRSAEWIWVPTNDAHPGVVSTITVKPHKKRRLKSAASPRVAPTSLLPPDIASDLEAFIRRAWSADTPLFEYLSSRMSGAVIHEYQLSSYITDAMKRVTGDPTIVKHHARHAFANHMMLACMADRIGLRSLRGALGDLGEAIDYADRYRECALGVAGGRRDVLTGISILLGHSTPATSCEHYIHVLDICLYAALREHSHLIDLAALKRASGLPRSTIRPGRVDSVEDLLHAVERANADNELRDDVPRQVYADCDGLAGAKEYEGAFDALKQICDEPTVAVSGAMESMLDRSRTLASTMSAKFGLARAVHEMVEGCVPGRFRPAAVTNAEAARGAVRAANILSRLQRIDPADYRWLLDTFARGAQLTEGRVSVGSFAELQRFSRALANGGLPVCNQLYGRGVERRFNIDRVRPVVRGTGSYWISIGTPPYADQGTRRDHAGARWTWQMAYILVTWHADQRS
ncbi:MAG: hypothetical protein VX836_04650, partial [Pseudomonadota bacterium]|nr:hypothetical protein [Pseudomonadota bacterium]